MENKLPFLTENIRIPSYLADYKSQLRPDSLFMLLQEMSNRHASLLGVGWHDLQKRGFFWVITKMSLKIKRMPRWTETVVLRSWVRPSDTATSPRDFEFEDSDGNIIVSGSSVWAILDTTSNRPQRMSDFDSCFSPQQRQADCEKPRKIRSIPLPETPPFTKEVELSDIDMNMHVNNTHYIQWAFNSMPETYYREHSLEEISVNFLSQARLGESYSVQTATVSTDEFISTIYSDKDKKEFCRIHSKWTADTETI